MNEPKRRGRPPKLSTFAEAKGAGVPVDEVKFYRDPFDVAIAQAYADRVWSGQSESAPREWRVSRVKEALDGQGLSMDGVTLPD